MNISDMDNVNEAGSSNSRNTTMLSDNESVSSTSTNSTICPLNESRIDDHLEKCVKLYFANKITSQNAWDLHIIHCMKKKMKKNELVSNDPNVCMGLDISSKVYGLRVDSLHKEVLELARSLRKYDENPSCLQQENFDNNVGGNSPILRNKNVRTTKQKFHNQVIETDQKLNEIIVPHIGIYNKSSGERLITLTKNHALRYGAESLVASRYNKIKWLQEPAESNLTSTKISVEIPEPAHDICPSLKDFTINQWNSEEDEGTNDAEQRLSENRDPLKEIYLEENISTMETAEFELPGPSTSKGEKKKRKRKRITMIGNEPSPLNFDMAIEDDDDDVKIQTKKTKKNQSHRTSLDLLTLPDNKDINSDDDDIYSFMLRPHLKAPIKDIPSQDLSLDAPRNCESISFSSNLQSLSTISLEPPINVMHEESINMAINNKPAAAINITDFFKAQKAKKIDMETLKTALMKYITAAPTNVVSFKTILKQLPKNMQHLQHQVVFFALLDLATQKNLFIENRPDNNDIWISKANRDKIINNP